MTHTLNSSWLRRATYGGGYLTVSMGTGDDPSRWRDYTYKAPSWIVGVLTGWSAQGASVGKLWPKLARYCTPLRGNDAEGEAPEGQASDLDLSAALAASLEAA